VSIDERPTVRAGGETTVRADLRELARIRGWARAMLPDLTADLLTDVVMVLDELVSNALRHARPPVRVRLRRRPGRLRIEIDDGSAVTATRRAPASDGGRGLALVERCSAAWGQRRHDSGKTVWAELSLDVTRP
jgi:anti-sigma regulatory factor (Ser/Thr protein kinase)